uniref:SUN domain-containing protein n=2 Tax=Caenorhabditis tropicalis TaxID=1561998 RepID=A0A1I7UDA9_9PELO
MMLNNADMESAYGSESCSNPDQTLKKETFSFQELTKTREKWVHTYGQMIGMGIVSFILILLLINSYRMSSKIEETHLIVSNLQTQFDKLSKLELRTTSELQKAESLEKENEKVMEHLSKASKEMKPMMINEDVRNQEKRNEENPYKDSVYKINSASYMFGATVDTSYSSSSDLSGESDLVLLDRPNPPANRAWCSDENEPVLTVNLANYIKPTAVSYQHFKWNRTVPHGSPRVFNVFACLDFYCEKTEPLISNCEYKSSGQIQEQIYPIPSNSRTKSIGKVQFRFLKNHGNVKKTCVSLIRVYGESPDLPKMKEYKMDPNSRTCSDLRNKYHNNPFLYDKFEYKHCGTLFSNGCCSVCPECCDECYIEDYTRKNNIICGILGGVFFAFAVMMLIVLCAYIGDRREFNRSRQNGRH